MGNLKNMQFSNSKIYTKGFALFFSVVIIAVISAISFGLANVVYKQKTLSSLAYDSQTAFYAADAGMECALYSFQQVLAGAGSLGNCMDFAPDNFGQLLLLSKDPVQDFWSILPRDEPCFSIELIQPNPPSQPLISFSVKGYSVCKQNNLRYIERNLRAFF